VAADPETIGVEKSASHHVSQNEIDGDNPCSQHLSGNALVSDYGVLSDFLDKVLRRKRRRLAERQPKPCMRSLLSIIKGRLKNAESTLTARAVRFERGGGTRVLSASRDPE
jgi:hypothetical protein